MEKVKIIECPRDAMQGIHDFISTDQKIAYANQLLKVGFDTIDIGSFVSPKAVPQMADTAELLKGIDTSNSTSELLVIVVNERGANAAAKFEIIDHFGYPFAISETFLQRNINSTKADSLRRLGEIKQLADGANKSVVAYISMAFGNPYGDPWDAQIAIDAAKELYEVYGVKCISISDTVGVATSESIQYIFEALIPALPEVEFGAHLHTTPHTWKEKIAAAWDSGCRRFDGAIKGYGGCPMADDVLTGNMPTENMISYFRENGINTGTDKAEFMGSIEKAVMVFP